FVDDGAVAGLDAFDDADGDEAGAGGVGGRSDVGGNGAPGKVALDLDDRPALRRFEQVEFDLRAVHRALDVVVAAAFPLLQLGLGDDDGRAGGEDGGAHGLREVGGGGGGDGGGGRGRRGGRFKFGGGAGREGYD